ncbi:dehydrogenase [Microbispora rosea subsp. aerata]|nr:SDR family NAD(P)-dependent oxidoreductase [Microbispora rosea]GGO00961.1 dehydrogenase [Microbispora rosea subsp. aerata]GIH56436.1 dehydrogenase [Microbispora rosea subsp. aerata]GLJ84397.1 dehydrogenase [Microbispora rosea subsp. aerata]
MNTDDISGKVALVTGGAGGIGAGVARRLAAYGARVVLADVDAEAGERTAAEIGADFVRTDVSRLEDNQAVVELAVERHGGLDIAFLNAGVASGCGVGDDFDLARYRRVMGVNLDGVVFGVHAALPAMRAGGVIVATASMAGIVGIPQDPVYAANKHAVVGLVRSLGPRLEPLGIRVQALCPSFADTAILDDDIKALLDEMRFPILDVETVVGAFFSLLASEGTGECWFVVPGRESEPFVFRRAPGPR